MEGMFGDRGAVRIGRLAGIPIGIQPLWLLIVGLITYSLGHDYFPQQDPGLSEPMAYVLALLSALLLFAGIVLHELGHAIVARRRGVEVDGIDLWLLGGVSRLRGEPRAAGDELRYAAAGPAVTAAILAVLGALRLAAGGALPAWARAMVDYQLYVTAAILILNLLPAFPLDGGRIARSALWLGTRDREAATRMAIAVGRVFAIGMIALGTFALLDGVLGGLWFALIGGFLWVAGAAEQQQTQVEHALAGRAVAEVMTPDPVTMPADITVEELIREGFGHHLFTSFPVVDRAGRAVGIATLQRVRAVSPARRSSSSVGEIARLGAAELLVPAGLPVTELLARPAFQQAGRAVVVDDERRPVGIVSITDLNRRIRAAALNDERHQVTQGSPPARM